jgi:hypothetical protein
VLQKCAGRWGWFWRPKLGSEKRNGCQPCPEAGRASPIQTIPTSVRSQRERPENRRCSTVVPRRFDRVLHLPQSEINAGALAEARTTSAGVGTRYVGLELDPGIDDRPENTPDVGGAQPSGRAARGRGEDRGFSAPVPAVPRGERGADNQSGPESEKVGDQPVDLVDRTADPAELGTLTDPAICSAA